MPAYKIFKIVIMFPGQLPKDIRKYITAILNDNQDYNNTLSTILEVFLSI